MPSIAFKEWALVCEALGDGRQSLILRKGGIAEGRGGFSFRYSEFFLFPTFFHEQVDLVRGDVNQTALALKDEIELRFFVRVERSFWLQDWEKVKALEPLHVLRESVVRERFEWKSQAGIHAAFVRVFRLANPWRLPESRAYDGCRSWIELPDPPVESNLLLVLDDHIHEQRQRLLLDLTNGS